MITLWILFGSHSVCHDSHECTPPFLMSDSTEIFFLCVPSNNRNVCFLCVKSKSKEMLSMSVSRWQELFFLEGQARLRSSGIDAARIWYMIILDLVFVSCWYNAIGIRRFLLGGVQTLKAYHNWLCWMWVKWLDESVRVQETIWFR